MQPVSYWDACHCKVQHPLLALFSSKSMVQMKFTFAVCKTHSCMHELHLICCCRCCFLSRQGHDVFRVALSTYRHQHRYQQQNLCNDWWPQAVFGAKAPVMTPSGVDFSSLFLIWFVVHFYRCSQVYQALFVGNGHSIACGGPKSDSLSLYCCSSGRWGKSSPLLGFVSH